MPLHDLSQGDARRTLEAFLRLQREVMGVWHIGGIQLDFSEKSLAAALRYVALEEIVNRHIPEPDQNILFARLGYYLGESLRRVSTKLYWNVGNPEWAFANHPVIAGFPDGEEAPVIQICKNVVRAVAEEQSKVDRIDTAIGSWFESARSA